MVMAEAEKSGSRQCTEERDAGYDEFGRVKKRRKRRGRGNVGELERLRCGGEDKELSHGCVRLSL